jgi:hypothetical protein
MIRQQRQQPKTSGRWHVAPAVAMIAGIIAGMIAAALPGGTTHAAGPTSDASTTGKTPKIIDVATLTCEAAGRLAADDPKRYGEFAQWLTGWLAEENAVTDVSFAAVAKVGGAWTAACRDTPAALLTAVASLPNNQSKNGGQTVSMAAMRCQEFLALQDEDGAAAMAVIRWLDGWNARATNETDANFYDHKKQLQSATDGCMKYPKRAIMSVVAGRYR